jgi:hypothetical protein
MLSVWRFLVHMFRCLWGAWGVALVRAQRLLIVVASGAWAGPKKS